MTGKITFTIIKPDAFMDKNSGAIIKIIEEAGFMIKAVKLVKLVKENARKFYAVHKNRPFFNDLVDYMTSGPIIAMVLEKDNAVDDFRKLIGSTNPQKATEGTIRKIFARNIEKNAIHGSDSDDNALIESSFFFSQQEIID